MYLEHFGLKEMPFALTPNTAFLYERAGHREALNVLLVALRGGEGFIKIVGEVGTGKTLLCRALLNALGEDFCTAYIPNPLLTPLGLHFAVAEELGLNPPQEIHSHHLVKQIAARLMTLHADGKKVALLLDEAQALPTETLEAVRLLTNLETETSKLLQVVLFGQPELDVLLAQPSLRQVKQRLSFCYQLQPLDRTQLEGYVTYRLAVAGCELQDIFTPGALDTLRKGSQGIPRLVTILAHKALMVAFGRGDHRIKRRHVRQAIADTEDARSSRLLRPPGSKSRLGALSAGLARLLVRDAWGRTP
jgi:MSHA biogenesis protein MshM